MVFSDPNQAHNNRVQRYARKPCEVDPWGSIYDLHIHHTNHLPVFGIANHNRLFQKLEAGIFGKHRNPFHLTNNNPYPNICMNRIEQRAGPYGSQLVARHWFFS